MRIHNTLTGQKEEFVLDGEVVRMYVCGVTPYDECHIGHAMSYIFFDVLRRYLEFRGYRVKHVQNFTDVDDKIISRAQERGMPAAELAQGFMQHYFEDMDALNIQRATHYPQATQVIPEILEMVQGLVAKGYAYVVGGDVYFRVQRFPGYGKLSHRTLEGMQAGARLYIAEVKEHPMDFALWKSAKAGEPSWESPWGPGRPGWHIECSAMSLKYLGRTLDIHGGGQDLIFPHHENEIAQSEAFTGVVPFVRYWVHNGMVQLGSEKMSKSLGNLVTVKEVLGRWNSDALRLFVLSSHYRSPLTYSEEGLDAAERGVERLRTAMKESDKGGGLSGLEAGPCRQRFIEAMEDDLNTSQAQAVLFDLARDINRGRDEGRDVSALQGVLRELSGVLGLTLKKAEKAFEPALVVQQGLMKILVEVKRDLEPGGIQIMHYPETDAADSVIGTLVEARTKLREARQWQKADGIRAQLAELGIVLEDTPQGTVWRYRR